MFWSRGQEEPVCRARYSKHCHALNENQTLGSGHDDDLQRLLWEEDAQSSQGPAPCPVQSLLYELLVVSLPISQDRWR